MEKGPQRPGTHESYNVSLLDEPVVRQSPCLGLGLGSTTSYVTCDVCSFSPTSRSAKSVLFIVYQGPTQFCVVI